MKKIALNLLTFTIIFASLGQRAFAHAHLASSTPQENSTVTGPAVAIDLKFTSRLDSARSYIALMFPDGKLETLRTSGDSGSELAAQVRLAPGKYTIRWQALSTDGHITRGAIPFIVR